MKTTYLATVRIISASLLILTALPAISHGQSTAPILCDYDIEQKNQNLNKESHVSIHCSATEREIKSNAIPNHQTGTFPNKGNPNRIAEQMLSYRMPITPKIISKTGTSVRIPGIAINGVKFEPETAETYHNEGKWRIEAIQQYMNLGLDEQNAHVQPTGEYHYHGIPEALVSVENRPTLIGWAADGFPVYVRYGYQDPNDKTSGSKVMQPSYRLKTQSDAGRPTDVTMGVFVQDYEYVAGLGDLDECNGRFGVTPEFPEGIYHYYLTDDYPYIQRCVKGEVIDTAFTAFGPPPGSRKQGNAGKPNNGRRPPPGRKPPPRQ